MKGNQPAATRLQRGPRTSGVPAFTFAELPCAPLQHFLTLLWVGQQLRTLGTKSPGATRFGLPETGTQGRPRRPRTTQHHEQLDTPSTEAEQHAASPGEDTLSAHGVSMDHTQHTEDTRTAATAKAATRGSRASAQAPDTNQLQSARLAEPSTPSSQGQKGQLHSYYSTSPFAQGWGTMATSSHVDATQAQQPQETVDPTHQQPNRPVNTQPDIHDPEPQQRPPRPGHQPDGGRFELPSTLLQQPTDALEQRGGTQHGHIKHGFKRNRSFGASSTRSPTKTPRSPLTWRRSSHPPRGTPPADRTPPPGNEPSTGRGTCSQEQAIETRTPSRQRHTTTTTKTTTRTASTPCTRQLGEIEQLAEEAATAHGHARGETRVKPERT